MGGSRMYVIKKKRICLILIALLLGIFAYSYENQKINIDEQTQSTTATPVSGKVIVVDAGHGVPDERRTE
jgi:hypothetical protein